MRGCPPISYGWGRGHVRPKQRGVPALRARRRGRHAGRAARCDRACARPRPAGAERLPRRPVCRFVRARGGRCSLGPPPSLPRPEPPSGVHRPRRRSSRRSPGSARSRGGCPAVAASRSRSTTARTRRERRPCSPSSTGSVSGRRSSSSASRSRATRAWRRRSPRPGTSSRSTATGTCCICGGRPRALDEDCRRAAETIEAATGVAPGLYRPPYGVFAAASLLIVRRLGWRQLLWSKWGRDWERNATPASIAALATRGLRGGDVVLLHDADHYSSAGSWRRTAAALPLVVEAARAAGEPLVAASQST